MTLYYFAYGSNLDPEQMEERCPEAEPFGPAFLPGHALAFGGHSPHWEGAPATVIREKGRRVPGLLYELPYREIRVLDHFEGHPVRYERREKRVVEPGDVERTAQVYVKDLDGNFAEPPEEYLAVLREGYRELGFDNGALEAALHLARSDPSPRSENSESPPA